uniref:Tetraspanin n=1 Tax=Opisthorchis viverrini TaxID=6198 RepID=K9NWL8_OPIVI|nr:tetraspanin 1 [Opisthorchis viverrini]
MMGCVQCLRILLVVFNFLVVLVGLVVLGFSVYVSQEPEAQDIIRASGHYVAVQIALYALMGVGGITLITALFGCCGAYHESQCLLGAYFIILLVIFTSQVTGATLGYVFREEIMQHVEQQMFEGVEEYSMLRDQRENPSPFMDNIHRVLQCCGVNGYTDYRDRIPVTCCDRRKSNCNELQLTPDEVYTEGCKEKYKRFFKDKLIVFFLIAVSIAAFEIFCLLFSMVLCCAIRQYHSDYYGVDYAIAT